MWKDKTCERCMYRDEKICRKFPPMIYMNTEIMDSYPMIASIKGEYYQQACSYYEETK